MRRSLICVLAFMILVSCSAYPVYRPPGQRAKRKPIPAAMKSKINEKKMNYIVDSYLGTPFRNKGTSRHGIDCSGLVVEVYRRYAGVNLPHSTKKLYKLSKVKNLLYGDLVFFAFDSNEVSHVGIYIGGGKFVHTSESQGVIISSLDEDHYAKSYVGARRVIP